jgi:hypothetical protein
MERRVFRAAWGTMLNLLSSRVSLPQLHPPLLCPRHRNKIRQCGKVRPSLSDMRTSLTVITAYYNAGSAAIVLVLIIAVLGTIFWCRIRKRRLRGLPITRNEEEHIPLTQGLHTMENESLLDTNELRTRKGKERAEETEPTPIFDVGDSDEEGGGHST